MTMLRALLVLVSLCLLTMPARSAGWAEQQNKAPRVVEARKQRGEKVRQLFETAGLDYPARTLLIRVFKREAQLELWAAGDGDEPMRLVTTYAICATSGILGPKRRQGDLQVPEGFYQVTGFNAASSYHLSFKIDYPNKSDRILGRQLHHSDLGGDICIHGDCVTIGCVPIQDEPMEELYLAALDTRIRYGVSPRVHLYPARLEEPILRELAETAASARTLRLWRNLRQGYDAFEAKHRLPTITVGTDGYYRVQRAP